MNKYWDNLGPNGPKHGTVTYLYSRSLHQIFPDQDSCDSSKEDDRDSSGSKGDLLLPPHLILCLYEYICQEEISLCHFLLDGLREHFLPEQLLQNI